MTCSLCGCSQNRAAEKCCLGDGGRGSISALFVTRVLVEGTCLGHIESETKFVVLEPSLISAVMASSRFLLSAVINVTE